MKVFHPNAPSNRSRSLSATYSYKKHEDEKIRTYGQCMHEVEHGVFTPLVIFTSGVLGREAETFYKCLADLLSMKWDVPLANLLGYCCLLLLIALQSVLEVES